MREDGDEFDVRSGDARADERHAGQDLRADSADAEGRRDPAQRRHRRRRPPRVPRVGRARAGRSSFRTQPLARRDDDDRADRLGASRRQGSARAEAGRHAACLRRSAAGVGRHRAVCDSHVQPDHRRRRDPSAAGGDCQRSLRLHRPRRRRSADRHRPRVREAAGPAPPYYATPGDGIFHFYFPEQGLVVPGQFIPGADSHSRAYGAYGAVGIGVGSTTLGFGWATGYVYFTLATGAPRRASRARCSRGSRGKDIVLELLRRWGAKQSQGMSVEFVDAHRQLPIAYRNTIANMMAEAEALNGIFAADDVTDAWYAAQGRDASCRIRASRPATTRATRSTKSCRSTDVVPMIAKPFSPGNAFPAGGGRARANHVRQGADRLVHQRQLRRSAPGGARDPSRARRGAHARGARASSSFPGRAAWPADRAPRSAARRRVDRRRVSRRSAARFGSRGADPASARVPTRCTPASARSRRSIATGRTAWASAAKATWRVRRSSPRRRCAGYMAPPSELGLKWDPEVYGIYES